MTIVNEHGLPKLPVQVRPRRRLFNLNRRCFWCGRVTRLRAKQGAPDLATVDHLYSRLHPERLKNKTKVLACQECNHARSVADQRGVPFVPKLIHRTDIAHAASAGVATDVKAPALAADPLIPKTARVCRHMQIVNVLEAHEHMHTVQKITGLRTIVNMCGLCGSWRVVITDRLTQAKMEKVRSLLSQQNLATPDYLN